MSFFRVDFLSAGYGKENIIDNISFEFDKGSVIGILGANGSGKTTLLKAIGGILPHTGTCVLNSVQLETLSARKMARMCSYIPQRSGITLDISALDVVLMGFNPRLGLLEYPSESMKQEAGKALQQVGLSDMEQTNYLRMSEGQKQLCILARALVADSQLLLLDEPESALDFQFRYHMLDLIRSWVRRNGRGALVTLHDPMLALNYCDKLMVLSDGKLLGMITPEKDSLEQMEEVLRKIYGAINLQMCRNNSGKDVWVMLREDKV